MIRTFLDLIREPDFWGTLAIMAVIAFVLVVLPWWDAA